MLHGHASWLVGAHGGQLAQRYPLSRDPGPMLELSTVSFSLPLRLAQSDIIVIWDGHSCTSQHSGQTPSDSSEPRPKTSWGVAAETLALARRDHPLSFSPGPVSGCLFWSLGPVDVVLLPRLGASS